jgi:DNA-directed RNA polymerase subunit RPC12/RpoP
MITFKCPNCAKTFRAKDEFAGKQTKCPECGAPIIVPAVSLTPSGATSLSDSQRFCSACGGSLQEGARFCSACGSAVSPGGAGGAPGIPTTLACPVCGQRTALGQSTCEYCKLEIGNLPALIATKHRIAAEQGRVRNELTDDARRVLEDNEYIGYMSPGDQGRKIYVVTEKRFVVFAVKQGLLAKRHALEFVIEFAEIISYSEMNTRRAGLITIWSYFTIHTQSGPVEFRFLVGTGAHDYEGQQAPTFYYHFLEMYRSHIAARIPAAALLLRANLAT